MVFRLGDFVVRRLRARSAAARKVIGLELLQPDLPAEFWTMIEVAPDAEQLAFVVHGFALHGPTRAVPLDL